MEYRTLMVRSISLLGLLLITAAAWFESAVVTGQTAQLEGTVQTSVLTVHFLDVGQGDAILLETPEGVQMLVDGGPDSSVLRALSDVMPFYDRTLDLLVATHPDLDHIGGLTDVLERYQVDHILTTDNRSDTAVSAEFTNLVSIEGAEVRSARRGQVYRLGASTTVEVLHPESSARDLESNTSSIVLKVTYGTTSFLLTGDAPKSIEEYLVLTYGEHLLSDVLKVGHHGSLTSTSELFLNEVDPTYAVISAGQNNRYGHPHLEVTDLLFNERVSVFETATDGTVTLISDGVAVRPR